MRYSHSNGDDAEVDGRTTGWRRQRPGLPRGSRRSDPSRGRHRGLGHLGARHQRPAPRRRQRHPGPDPTPGQPGSGPTHAPVHAPASPTIRECRRIPATPTPTVGLHRPCRASSTRPERPGPTALTQQGTERAGTAQFLYAKDVHTRPSPPLAMAASSAASEEGRSAQRRRHALLLLSPRTQNRCDGIDPLEREQAEASTPETTPLGGCAFGVAAAVQALRDHP